jgi:8-oxo-dGTP pyrophosphatase MutT (NUDIX family)
VQIRAAAYAVVVHEGRMLLPHWSEGDGRHGWTLPGGGLEPGEEPEDAAVREVEEETGYAVRLGERLGIDTFLVSGEERLDPGDGALLGVRIVYRAEVVGGDLRVEADGSTDDVRWFTPDEVDALDRVELVDVARRWAGLV